MKTAIVALALSFTLATAAAAQEFERVLLPVVVQGVIPGAYGSLWVGELTLHNSSRLSVQTDPMPCELQSVPCQGLIAANSVVHFRPSTGEQKGTAVRPVFMYIPTIVAKEIHLHLTIRDISRANESDGIELPIVRESEFRTEKISLLDIPVREFRTTLRLYNGSDAPTHVRVRVFDLESQSALVDRVVGIAAAQLTENGNGHFLQPGFAELGDLIAEAQQRKPGLEQTRIEIDPSNVAVWGFASITNNSTQQVSLVTPQKPL
jgi:hypothetical protein